ncbi:MAG: MoaD/ThiS family protein [Mycobacteriales bacterium]
MSGVAGRCTVRFYAGARDAAGVAERDVDLEPGATVAEVLATFGDAPALARVLPRCSLLLDGVAVRSPALRVAAGSCLDVLPPFAGG